MTATSRFFPKLLALSLLMVVPLWATLAFKWPVDIDLLFYSTALKTFSAQLWAGDFYPRWLADSNAGFGSPVFLFYSPLPFYAMSLFQWLDPVDPHGFGRIFIGMILALILAGITSRRWLAHYMDDAQAQKGALLYAGFPFLFLLVYFFFAMAQLWALALFPLLLEAAHNVAKKGWRAAPKLGLSYALLCLAHLPSALMFAPVPLAVIAAFSPRGKRLLYTLWGVCAAALGVASSAIYLFPAIVNKPYISVSGFLQGKFDYAHNFLDINSLFGLAVVIAPLFGLWMEVPKTQRRECLPPYVRFWLAVLAALLFMILPVSKPLWDHFPPLHYLQGPLRFFNAMLPGAVAIAVCWLPHAKSRILYKAAFVLGLAFSIAYSPAVFFFDSPHPSAAIMQHRLIDVPEYRTIWMEKENLDIRRDLPKSLLEMPPVTFAEGSGHAEIIRQSPRSITLHADIDSPHATLVLRQFYFPGWQAEKSDITVHENHALLAVALPGGDRDVTLTRGFDGEREGLALSLFALGLLTIWWGMACWRAPVRS